MNLKKKKEVWRKEALQKEVWRKEALLSHPWLVLNFMLKLGACAPSSWRAQAVDSAPARVKQT
jgi:hypothetical protein